MTSVRVLDSAQREFDKAFDWFSKRSKEAAVGFATEVDEAVRAIATDPERYAKTYAGCQYRMLDRFPYCVIYYYNEQLVTVVAVAHSKRRPGYWRKRV